MIYRIVLDEHLDYLGEGYHGKYGKMYGPMNACAELGKLMDECGLDGPKVSNKRARFYFTEKGWRVAGRRLASEARKHGHTVKCIRRKNPRQSQVVYRDELQVAILPRKEEGAQ
jgi:hypothetical protein